MAYLMTAKELCERSLRKIQAYAINDTAARPQDLAEALYWLDLMMADLAGETRLWWLVPQTVTADLAASTASYDLLDAMGAAAPDDGFLFPVHAKLFTGEDVRLSLRIVGRKEFDEIEDLTTEGTPEIIHIDRDSENPTMRVYPVPTALMGDYQVELTVQTFTKTVAPAGVTGAAGVGNRHHGLRQTWQMWAVLNLSAQIGDGPVRTRPLSQLKDWREQAAALKAKLLAFENLEHDSDLILTPFRDF